MNITKETLFKKYRITKGHSVWDETMDNWMSIEIYRETHGGKLPDGTNATDSIKYVLDFIEKTHDREYFFGLQSPGSMFTTAKRMIYRYADQLVKELNNAQEGK